MGALAVPCSSGGLNHFQLETDLDGSTYVLEFRWNERTSAWFMSLSDASQNLLYSGVRVTVGFPLAFRSRYDTRMPPGMFVATDTTGKDSDPGFDDLGARVQIYYYPASDLLGTASGA